MTTIVATRQGIYADTLCSYTVPFKVAKIHRIGKSLFAGAGGLENIKKFIDWKRTGKEPEYEDDDGFDVIELSSAGIVIWSKRHVPLEVLADCYAIGSGAQFAMGAIAMGATPQQAIEVAAKYDNQTALPIDFVKLKAR